MMTDVKEVNKHYRLAKWHFNKAVELGKKNLLVGEVNFPGADKKARVRKAPRSRSEISTPELEGKILADLDKNGYMSKRKKPETADNA